MIDLTPRSFALLLAVVAGLTVAVGLITLLRRSTMRVLTLYFLAVTAVSLGFDGSEGLLGGVRYVCVALLAISAPAQARLPTPLRLMLASAAVTLLFLPNSPSAFSGALFIGGMLLMTGAVGRLLAKRMLDEHFQLRALHLLARCSAAYVVFGIFGLGSRLDNQRFSGLAEEPATFATVGGFLVPLLVWAVLTARPRWRLPYCAILAGVMSLTLLSGQRAGPIAALVGSIPLLAWASRRAPTRIFWLGGLAGVIYVLLSSGAFEFALSRLFTLESTGRSERWLEGYSLVRDSGLLGHGPASLQELDFGLHNALLAVWYEGGFLAAVLWTAGVLMGLSRTAAGLRRPGRANPQSVLAFGWVLAAVTVSAVESKLYSPTNIVMLVFVLSVCIAEANDPMSRLRALTIRRQRAVASAASGKR